MSKRQVHGPNRQQRAGIRIVSVGGNAAPAGYLVFDLSEERLLPRETDYADHLIELSLAPSTRSKYLSDVVEFIEYSRAKDWKLSTIDDAKMKIFAAWLLDEVKADKSHRGSDDNARMTVNAKLNSIFHWSRWLQIQPNAENLIYTVPPAADRERRHTRSGRRIRSSDEGPRIRSPAVFSMTGSKKKHRTGFVLEKEQEHVMMSHVFDQSINAYASHRNRLFAKISCETGLRLGSTNSLKITQFVKEEVFLKDTLLVTPIRQKFGYTNETTFSSELVMEVLDFNRDYREPLIDSKNKGVDLSGGALFLSSRDALPMENRSFTRIFSHAMRALGARKGNAVHVLRSYFICGEIDDEIETRVRLGLDTSDSTIADQVAIKVGHSDRMSLIPYVVLMQSLRRQRARAEKRRKELADAQEMLDLKREVARLRTQLGKSDSNP